MVKLPGPGVLIIYTYVNRRYVTLILTILNLDILYRNIDIGFNHCTIFNEEINDLNDVALVVCMQCLQFQCIKSIGPKFSMQTL